MATRKRSTITATVDDARIGKTVVTAYDGLLPEEGLLLLMEQNITLNLRGFSTRESRANVWHPLNEEIQGVITNGAASAAVGGS